MQKEHSTIVFQKVGRLNRESKQKTLEEAAEIFRSNNPGTSQGGNNTKILNAFTAGAKWQEKQDEEMLRSFIRTNHLTEIWDKWFEQFKKK